MLKRQYHESTEASASANFGHILNFGFGSASAKISKFAKVSAEVYASILKIKSFNLKINIENRFKVLLS